MKAAVRVPMPPPVRAKQFAPFQALNGLMEAILERYQGSHEATRTFQESYDIPLSAVCGGFVWNIW